MLEGIKENIEVTEETLKKAVRKSEQRKLL